jgi:hypothetical protein
VGISGILEDILVVEKRMNRRFMSGTGWTGAGAILLLLLGAAAFVLWNRTSREYPQPKWITEGDEETRFMYLSLGAERDTGIPYWIFYVMPLMFPEKLPAEGGYVSLGLSWEEGKELPVGLSKTVIGYPRVSMNCAFCHTQQPKLVNGELLLTPTRRGHMGNAEKLHQFLLECAKDPKFNSDNILTEIRTWTKLDWIDRVLYRFFIIPDTKKRLLERGEQFAKKFDSEAQSESPRGTNAKADTHGTYSEVVHSRLGLLGIPRRDNAKFADSANRITEYLKNR